MTDIFDLRQDGVTMVTYSPDMRAAVQEAAAAWEAFCDLPDDAKRPFAMANSHASVGYESKDGSGPHGDRKENFDITFEGYEQLRPLLGPEDTIAARFLDAARTLGELIAPMVIELGQQIEAQHNIEGFAALAERSAHSAFFRFLHYRQANRAGDLMAEPHDDNSGLTVHLWETHPGCERLSFDGIWQPLPVAGDQAVAFGGMQMQLVSKGELRALVHRVIADQRSTEVGRQAIVCFVAFKGVPPYDKATNGRLQELPGMAEGITYTMRLDEFARLFKV